MSQGGSALHYEGLSACRGARFLHLSLSVCLRDCWEPGGGVGAKMGRGVYLLASCEGKQVHLWGHSAVFVHKSNLSSIYLDIIE